MWVVIMVCRNGKNIDVKTCKCMCCGTIFIINPTAMAYHTKEKCVKKK